MMIMNSLKKSMGWAKVLTFAFALSCLMFFFPTTAMAGSCSGVPVTPGSPFKTITIRDGSFSVQTPPICLSRPEVIRSVKVSLTPSTATGNIDSIIITGPEGKREFGCNPQAVKQGTNLIRACGGPAVLDTGDTIYMATGSGFTGDRVQLTVNFSSNFEP
jgi:hypothetical protein